MANWLKSLLVSTIILSGCEQASYQTLSGERGPVSELHQQWLIINYWASWCTPCREEIPELNTFSREFQGSVRVMAVNFDNLQGTDLSEATLDMGISFDSLLADPAGQMGFARPLVLPTTVVIAPGGEIRHILSGPQTLASLTRAIERESGND